METKQLDAEENDIRGNRVLGCGFWVVGMLFVLLRLFWVNKVNTEILNAQIAFVCIMS